MDNNIKTIQARIDELETLINDTRDDFLSKIVELKTELHSLRKLLQNETRNTEPQPDITSSTPIDRRSKDTAQITDTPQATQSSAAARMQASVDTTSESVSQKPPPPTPEPAVKTQEKPQAPAEPGMISEFFSGLSESLLVFILSRLSIITAPFQELYHKIVSLYYHYQKQGKAPVFLMTVAGILTLTVGFGYLLQYSFNFLFDDTLKTISGFVVGIAFVGLGIFLAVKKKGYEDYAASVIALGIIFNYLTAYFAGPYFGIVPEPVGLLLLLGITVVSFILAIIFETRVVSVVTLVGGVFMPFIIGDASSAGLVFLAYLFILSTANLYLAHKIKWPALAHLTFVLSLSVIEYIGISTVAYPLLAIALLTAFFYSYAYFWTFTGVTLKETLSKQDLTILVANVFYYIYATLQLPVEHIVVAAVFIANAVVLGFIIKILRLMQSLMAPVMLLMIGLLIATAVFVLAPTDITSIIWAIEGLALLYIGFRYSQTLIRVEGYTIYVIAMASLLWHAVLAFYDTSSSAIAWHWINLLAFGALSFAAYRIIYRFKAEATFLENKAAYVQNEIFSTWGAVTLSLVIALYVPSVMTILAVIPLLWCFYRVSQHKLYFTQGLGYFFLIAFIAQIIIGVLNTHSLIISQQSWVTWVALVELLFFTWALHFFNQRYSIKGRGANFAETLHNIIFYAPFVLITLSLFNIFNQHVYTQTPLAFSYLFIDFIILGGLLFIAHWLVNKTETAKEGEIRVWHSYLISETLSLYASIFFLYTVAILFNEWMFNAAAIPLLLLIYRGLKQDLPLTEKFAWGHFALFVVMTVISYFNIGNLHFSAQTWATRIGWLEVLLAAWAMQLIYEKFDNKKGMSTLAAKVRIAVYLILPLLFLPRVNRLYTEYLPVAFWVSFTISWLMYKRLKIDALQKELTVLYFVAIAATIIMALNAITGANEIPGLLALISGALIISLFHYVEKTLSQQTIKDSVYHILQISSPYFYGFVLAALSYALLHQITVSLAITGLFFLYLTQEHRVRIVMRESINLSYSFATIGLLGVPLLILLQGMQPNLHFAQNKFTIVVNIVALLGFWYLTHHKSASLQLLRRKLVGQNIQLWVFHLIVLIAYIGSLNLIFTPWSVGTSIAMLIHAVVILFLTLIDKYKALLRLSVALFALTAAKVLFHDMNDFSNIHKIIALIGMGSILMVAAFMFQKLRNKQLS